MYYCDLLNNVYSLGSFFVVVMGNGKHVLLVLQWLEVVIAFVSSIIVIIFINFIFVTHVHNCFTFKNCQLMAPAWWTVPFPVCHQPSHNSFDIRIHIINVLYCKWVLSSTYVFIACQFSCTTTTITFYVV